MNPPTMRNNNGNLLGRLLSLAGTATNKRTLALIGVVMFIMLLVQQASNKGLEQRKGLASSELCSKTLTEQRKIPKPIQPLRKRRELGSLLQKEGLRTGVELGVQKGHFAREILSRWKGCTRYVLVDIWAPLENYDDIANKDKNAQEKLMKESLSNTEEWESIREVCRNFTTECAKTYQNEHFDFVYVDARHDYKGVLADLEAWWPLVKDGGIMAGHDFVTQTEGPEQTKQNWTINYDGTVDPLGRAVYGAVMDFFDDSSKPDRYRQISATYQEGGWYTWVVRK